LFYLRKENVDLVDSFTGDEAARHVVQDRIEELAKIIDRCRHNIDDVKSFMSLKEKFSELLMFVKLANRYPTRPIPTTNAPTPDFCVTFRMRELFVEVKSLNLLNSEANLHAIMEESLASKILIEEQVEAGKRMATAVHVIQPYFNGNEHKRDSTTFVVEALIDKVEQNLGVGQFRFGSTLLLIDFSEQLLVHGSARDNLMREFASESVPIPQSGELWHLAFGVAGMPMKRVVEFEGLDNTDTPLGRNGVLREHPFISALVVHYAGVFWGAAIRRRDNIQAIDFLEDLCEGIAIETE
jgi:hypothetical protein